MIKGKGEGVGVNPLTAEEYHYWVNKCHGVWCPVYGTLHRKDPLPSFEKSRVVIPAAGFSYHLIDSIFKD